MNNTLGNIVLLIWLSLTGIVQSADFYPEWTLNGNMPYPVAGAETVVHNGKIYILGGYSSEEQATVDWIQEYDPSTDSWQIVGNMLTPRLGHTADIHNGIVYYFGGASFGEDANFSYEGWNFLDLPTSIKVDTSSSLDRTFASGIVKGDYFFIFGGKNAYQADSQEHPFISVLDLNRKRELYSIDTLFVKGNQPYNQMICSKGNDIFLLGGVENGVSQKIYEFNTTDTTFKRISLELLQPRAGGTVVYFPLTDMFYVIGGYNENSQALADVDLFMAHGFGFFNIQRGQSLNVARNNPSVAYVNNQIFVFGGFDEKNEVISSVEVFNKDATTDISNGTNDIPTEYELFQNYPNPFNPTTEIKFSIPYSSDVSIEIYSLLGERIKTLVNNNISSGNYAVTWNGNDDSGNPVSSGVYFYVLRTDKLTLSKKMMLVK